MAPTRLPATAPYVLPKAKRKKKGRDIVSGYLNVEAIRMKKMGESTTLGDLWNITEDSGNETKEK